ncbi:MAG: O-antigen ligase family protein [Gemmatimonadales bacterium]
MALSLLAAVLVERALNGFSPLIVGGGAGLLGLAAVLVTPMIGLLALPALNSLRQVVSLATNLAPAVPVAVVTVLAVVIRKTLRHEPMLHRSSLHVPVTLLVVLCCALTPLQLENVTDIVSYLRVFVSMGVFYYLFAEVPRTARDLRLVVFAVLLGTAMPVVASLYQLATLGVLGAAIRSRALVENANVGAFFLASGAPFAIALGLSASSRRGRIGWWTAAALIAAAVLTTLSRTGLTVLLLTAALTVGLVTRRMLRVFRVVVFAALVVAAVGLVASRLPGAIGDAMVLLARRPSERLTLARLGARMVVDHPLTGVGPDQFRFNFVRYLSPDEFETAREFFETHIRLSIFEVDVPPHDAYVEAFSEEGVIGGALFVGIVGGTVVTGYRAMRRLRERADRETAALGAALFASLVGMAFFLTTIDLFNEKLVWQLVGMSVAFRGVADRLGPGVGSTA